MVHVTSSQHLSLKSSTCSFLCPEAKPLQACTQLCPTIQAGGEERGKYEEGRKGKRRGEREEREGREGGSGEEKGRRRGGEEGRRSALHGSYVARQQCWMSSSVFWRTSWILILPSRAG